MARILVIGAGALGGLLGALWTEKGHDTTLVTRSKPLHEIRLEGGAYGPDRTVKVQGATSAPAGPWDLVLVAVKTQDLESALQQHAPAFGSAPVVALQNGLAQDDIMVRVVGAQRAVAAIAALESTYLDAGRVEVGRKGTFVIGPVRPEARAAADAAARLIADAITVERTENVAGARWTKLLINLQNIGPAITGLSYQEAASHPGLARAVVRMMKEARAVSAAEGVTLAPLPWTNPLLLRAMSRMPEAVAAPLYARRVRQVLGKKPSYGSTFQSMERGRSLETDWLNGEVVRRGKARGVPTPVNARAVELAHKGARMTPDDAARALLG